MSSIIAEFTPHDWSDNYRQFQYYRDSIYSKCVVCFQYLAISPQSHSLAHTPIGHEYRIIYTEQSGKKKEKIMLAHPVHAGCMKAFYLLKQRCPICLDPLKIADMRTATFELSTRKRWFFIRKREDEEIKVTATHISPISQNIWDQIQAAHLSDLDFQDDPPIWRSEEVLKAARDGSLDAIKKMIASWTDIPSHVWQTALCCAAQSGHFSVVQFFLEGNDRAMGFADSNVWSHALCDAVKSGHLSIAERLLQRRIGTMDHLSLSCALEAAAEKGYVDICKILVEYTKNELSYYDRVRAFLQCDITQSRETVEKMLFLIEGQKEDFDLVNRKEIGNLRLLLSTARACLERETSFYKGKLLLESIVEQMNRSGTNSRLIFQQWLDRESNIDFELLALPVVLAKNIPIGSAARWKYMHRIFWQKDHTDQHRSWEESKNLLLQLLSAPGQPMSKSDRGEALFKAVMTGDLSLIRKILDDGEIFPSHWRRSRNSTSLSEIVGVLEANRPSSLRIFFEDYWHSFILWISEKWNTIY